MNEMIRAYSKQLGLPAFVRVSEAVRAAEENGWGYEDFLAHLMRTELAQRKENSLQRQVKLARFPLPKTLDTFDFGRLERVEEAFIWQLATGEFVKRHENAIMIGNPGTGKTHLAIGLGRRLCREGFKVRFHTATQLVTELVNAQESRRLSKIENQLCKIDVLIVDELSYMTLSKSHAELLFHLLSLRNERRSVIITTNLEFSRWGELFPDIMLAGALVDRLTHRSHILDMNGESYRLASRLNSVEVGSSSSGEVMSDNVSTP